MAPESSLVLERQRRCVDSINDSLGLTMDDLAVDDEKKPFDALGGQNDEDSQPDPDEHIMLESGQGRVWLVKVRTHAALYSPQLHNNSHLPSQDPEIPNGALVQIRRRGRTARQDSDLRRASWRRPTHHSARTFRRRR